jgi:hypothetical protein
LADALYYRYCFSFFSLVAFPKMIRGSEFLSFSFHQRSLALAEREAKPVVIRFSLREREAGFSSPSVITFGEASKREAKKERDLALRRFARATPIP